ncbi:centromere protein H [Rhinophrynus dorsalis]
MAASTEPLSELPVPLGNLQDVSVILGQVSLLAATGHEEDEKEVPDSLPLLRLLGFREQVKHQHFELQNVIEAEAREEATPDPLPVERLIEISKELVEEVDDMKLAYKNKTLVLQRMQFANALQSKLQEDDNESKLIRKTIGHILKLSSSVLKSQQASYI